MAAGAAGTRRAALAARLSGDPAEPAAAGRAAARTSKSRKCLEIKD